MELTELPFCRWIGLQKLQIDGEQVIALTPSVDHHNHVGTIHAAALFALAETASAQAMLDRYGERQHELDVVLRKAECKYSRLASGTVFGKGELDEQECERFEQQLARRGQALLRIPTQVWAGPDIVFQGAFTWFIARRTD